MLLFMSVKVECAWIGGPPQEWVFGPCKRRDNIYQNLPQVTLHGMDEGLIEKLNFGALELHILHGSVVHGKNATEVQGFHICL
jgi:hypothetical protein